MSLAEACAWSLARSVLLATVALPVAWGIVRSISQADSAARKILWGAALVPYFSPELLVGYSYAAISRLLVHHPYANEAVYSAAVFMKFVPVAAVVLFFAPPPLVSAEAIHCGRLAFGRGRGGIGRALELFPLWIRGSAQAFFPAWAVMFLLAFQEFEIASLMGKSAGVVHTPQAWTVWLFDKQTGGLFLSESLKLVLAPLCMEVLIIAPVLALAWLRSRDYRRRAMKQHSHLGRAGKRAIVLYLCVAAFLTAAFPLGTVLSSSLQGWTVLLNDFALGREIAASASLALVCAIAAWTAAAGILSLAARLGRMGWMAVCALAVPGLLGSLALSLVSLRVFQTSALAWLGDTAVGLVLALTLWLLPRAILLGLLWRATRPGEAIHLARLLRTSPSARQQSRGRSLFWELTSRAHFWALVVLFLWGYWELTAPALLAPPALVTAAQRLYNLMHYGRTAVLSAMLVATILVPVVLLLLASFARRPVLRWLFP